MGVIKASFIGAFPLPRAFLNKTISSDLKISQVYSGFIFFCIMSRTSSKFIQVPPITTSPTETHLFEQLQTIEANVVLLCFGIWRSSVVCTQHARNVTRPVCPWRHTIGIGSGTFQKPCQLPVRFHLQTCSSTCRNVSPKSKAQNIILDEEP